MIFDVDNLFQVQFDKKVTTSKQNVLNSVLIDKSEQIGNYMHLMRKCVLVLGEFIILNISDD